MELAILEIISTIVIGTIIYILIRLAFSRREPIQNMETQTEVSLNTKKAGVNILIKMMLNTLTCVLVISASAFAYYLICPKYHFIDRPDKTYLMPMRCNRITGEIEMLFGTEWTSIQEVNGKILKQARSEAQ
ncbi:MAG: hypothetical protein JXA82_15610 [Sedimentisphaerales bacterium]|nr:hypothetical protein [Sedimentisphaerales bacterium]